MSIQIPSIILPTVWIAGDATTVTGLELETVANALTHVGQELYVGDLEYKTVLITAIEVVTAGIPGPLNCWIELSPYLSTFSTGWWTAIGGGGGAVPPVTPVIEVGAGVDGRVHGIIIPWVLHSPYFRLVVQTPAPVATATWTVQAVITGK